MTKTDEQATTHHKMHTKKHALKKETPIYDLFSGRRETPLLVFFIFVMIYVEK